MSFFSQRGGGGGPGGVSNFFGSSARVAPGLETGTHKDDNEEEHTWEIEEGHNQRNKSQFQWDEGDAGKTYANAETEFMGTRRELLDLDRAIDKQMKWATGDASRIERLDSHRAPDTTRGGLNAAKKSGGYIIDDEIHAGEKDKEGFMSGISSDGNGNSMVRPQALATDDQVKSKLQAVLKENQSLQETLLKLQEMHRFKLKQLNKLSTDLAHAQDELAHAHHAATSGGGGGIFTAKVNINSVSAKESEERVKREKERKRLLQQGDDDDDAEGLFGTDDREEGFLANQRRRLMKYIGKRIPLTKDIEQVEARFGSSVAAYYQFNRWVTINSLSILIVYMLIMILHFYDLTVSIQEDDRKMDWVKHDLDFGPWFLSFVESFSFSAFSTNMKLTYSFLLIALNAVLIYISIQKWLVEDRKMKVIQALQGNEKKYTNIVLNCMDHTLHDKSNMKDHLMSNAEVFTTMLIDETILANKSGRTRKEKAILYSRRIALMSTYILIQGAAIYGIFQLIVQTAAIEEGVGLTADVKKNIPFDLVPVVVSVINTVVPQVITRLVKAEKWDDAGMTVKQIVMRIFLSKTINNLIQLLSYSFLTNAFFFQQDTAIFGITYREIRKSVAKTFDPTTYKCRADQAGSSLFNMMLTEFVMHKIFLVLFPAIYWVLGKLKKKKMKKSAFNIEAKMIGLLYYQQICLIALPLYPLAGTLMFITQFLNFKSEKHIMMWSNIKPKGGGGGNSANFFLKFFLLSGMISVLYCTFLLTYITFPKSCEIQAQSIPKIIENIELGSFVRDWDTKEVNSTVVDIGLTKYTEDLTYNLPADYKFERVRAEDPECITFLNEHIHVRTVDGNEDPEFLPSSTFTVKLKRRDGKEFKLVPRYKKAENKSLSFLSTLYASEDDESTKKKKRHLRQLVMCSCLYSCGPFSESYRGITPVS